MDFNYQNFLEEAYALLTRPSRGGRGHKSTVDIPSAQAIAAKAQQLADKAKAKHLKQVRAQEIVQKLEGQSILGQKVSTGLRACVTLSHKVVVLGLLHYGEERPMTFSPSGEFLGFPEAHTVRHLLEVADFYCVEDAGHFQAPEELTWTLVRTVTITDNTNYMNGRSSNGGNYSYWENEMFFRADTKNGPVFGSISVHGTSGEMQHVGFDGEPFDRSKNYEVYNASNTDENICVVGQCGHDEGEEYRLPLEAMPGFGYCALEDLLNAEGGEHTSQHQESDGESEWIPDAALSPTETTELFLKAWYGEFAPQATRSVKAKL